MKQKFKPIFAVILVASMVCLSACGGKPVSGTSQNSSGGGEILAENASNQNNDAAAESDSSESTAGEIQPVDSGETLLSLWENREDDNYYRVGIKTIEIVPYDISSYLSADGVFAYDDFLANLGFNKTDSNPSFDLVYEANGYKLYAGIHMDGFAIAPNDSDVFTVVNFVHPEALKSFLSPNTLSDIYGDETVFIKTMALDYQTAFITQMCNIIDQARYTQNPFLVVPPIGCNFTFLINGDINQKVGADAVEISDLSGSLELRYPKWTSAIYDKY